MPEMLRSTGEVSLREREFLFSETQVGANDAGKGDN